MPAECERMVETLEDAPELEAESSDELEYWALLCLRVLASALKAEVSADPHHAGGVACSLTLEIHGSIDVMLRNPVRSGRVQIVEGGTAPIPGSWELAEIARADQALEILSAAPSAEDARLRVRSLSRDHATALAGAMPDFIAAGEW